MHTTTTDTLPSMMTTREVAVAARVEPATIRQRVKRGLPPQPVRVGKLLRFRREDVRRWLEGRDR